MSDTHCQICNEPWDIWGLSHGDVTAWEADMIRKGYGCPCCIENGKVRSELYVKPGALVIATCEDCGEEISVDQDEIEYDGTDLHYTKTIPEDWELINNILRCADCSNNYDTCDECGKVVHSDSSYYFQEIMKCLCEDCLDTIISCGNCGTVFNVSDVGEDDKCSACGHSFYGEE